MPTPKKRSRPTAKASKPIPSVPPTAYPETPLLKLLRRLFGQIGATASLQGKWIPDLIPTLISADGKLELGEPVRMLDVLANRSNDIQLAINELRAARQLDAATGVLNPEEWEELLVKAETAAGIHRVISHPALFDTGDLEVGSLKGIEDWLYDLVLRVGERVSAPPPASGVPDTAADQSQWKGPFTRSEIAKEMGGVDLSTVTRRISKHPESFKAVAGKRWMVHPSQLAQ